MTKKSVLLTATTGFLVWFALFFIRGVLFSVDGYCYNAEYVGWCGAVASLIEGSMVWMFPVFALFTVALLLWFMSQSVFYSWRKFAYAWVPFSILVILITPHGSGSALLGIDEKALMALGLSLIFALVSFGIMIFKAPSTTQRSN